MKPNYRNLSWLQLGKLQLFLLLAAFLGCSDTPVQPTNQPGVDDENPKSGEVSELVFFNGGKNLAVVNAVVPFGNVPAKIVYTRIRNFSTADWKVVKDSGELSLVTLRCAASSGSWIITAEKFERKSAALPIRTLALCIIGSTPRPWKGRR